MNNMIPPVPKPSPILIALTSDAMGAGKSTVAAHLRDAHGFEIVKFAGPLKDMTRSFLLSAGIDAWEIKDMVEGSAKETRIPALGGTTPRHIMQTLGTEWGRDCIMPGLWVYLVRQRVDRLMASGKSVVIDDTRYLNEMLMVEEIKGTMIRVVRPDVADATGHSSEGALAGIPMMTIINDSDVAAMQVTIDAVVDVLMRK